MGQRAALTPPAAVAVGQAVGRLKGRTVRVTGLDLRARRAAFDLFAASYEGASWATFQRDLDAKQFAILLHDVRTGELKGFSTVQLSPAGKATVVFSGDTVIDPAYWGQKELQRRFAALILRLKLRRPWRPVYWFLISKGFRTYLIMVNRCPRSIPRYDQPDDPGLRRLLDALARGRFGDKYDPGSGVARDLGADRVRQGVAPIDGALLANPHVRFFLQRNPGHVRGDELCCLAETRLRDAVATLTQVLRRRVRR
jgi:hypothetical protein